ncbi:hypothetical protein SAMN05421823_113100 [Catalinimonas alkaloidigena]|uniref:Uncharacterized protein n=1 Tax=Catalinimonas alkaloidigena TaxID=1075417 RepID=A0A1G9T674_9BACT|nr:hypothetical protein SAMN05421823_113100 [Catalinimonas alkaloidigena]
MAAPGGAHATGQACAHAATVLGSETFTPGAPAHVEATVQAMAPAPPQRVLYSAQRCLGNPSSAIVQASVRRGVRPPLRAGPPSLLHRISPGIVTTTAVAQAQSDVFNPLQALETSIGEAVPFSQATLEDVFVPSEDWTTSYYAVQSLPCPSWTLGLDSPLRPSATRTRAQNQAEASSDFLPIFLTVDPAHNPDRAAVEDATRPCADAQSRPLHQVREALKTSNARPENQRRKRTAYALNTSQMHTPGSGVTSSHAKKAEGMLSTHLVLFPETWSIRAQIDRPHLPTALPENASHTSALLIASNPSVCAPDLRCITEQPTQGAIDSYDPVEITPRSLQRPNLRKVQSGTVALAAVSASPGESCSGTLGSHFGRVTTVPVAASRHRTGPTLTLATAQDCAGSSPFFLRRIRKTDSYSLADSRYTYPLVLQRQRTFAFRHTTTGGPMALSLRYGLLLQSGASRHPQAVTFALRCHETSLPTVHVDHRTVV